VLVHRTDRERRNGHRAALLWFTGLSGAGKSTLAHSVEAELFRRGCHSYVFDGDNVRHGLCGDLGFSPADRSENLRRIGEAAKLFLDAGVIVLAAFISPTRADREQLRAMFAPGDFIEIYCRCALEVCEARDRKGLYARARAGEIADFTGISAPYEEPRQPELVLDTGTAPLDECAARVIGLLEERQIVRR